jgi:hypothetical protein
MMRPMARPVLVLMALLVSLLGFGTSSYSHALQPGYLELRLIDTDLYAVIWKTPVVGGRPMTIVAQLPESCDPRMPGQPIWDGVAYPLSPFEGVDTLNRRSSGNRLLRVNE